MSYKSVPQESLGLFFWRRKIASELSLRNGYSELVGFDADTLQQVDKAYGPVALECLGIV